MKFRPTRLAFFPVLILAGSAGFARVSYLCGLCESLLVLTPPLRSGGGRARKRAGGGRAEISASAERQLRPLRRNLDPIPIRIQHDAFVVSIARAARTVDDREAIRFQASGQRIDRCFGADADREVRESHALRARLEHDRIERRRLHDFQSRTALEAEEYGFEALRRIDIACARARAEIAAVEIGAAIEIARPQCNVLDAHRLSRQRPKRTSERSRAFAASISR